MERGESAATRQALSAALPISLASGYSYDFNGTLIPTAVSHPVTQGIGSFATTTYSEFPVSGLRADAGSQILATINGHIAVAVATPGNGRSVYLGPIYSGSSAAYNNAGLRSGPADRLMEQAIAWAKGLDSSDNYTFQATAGREVVISTATPGDGALEPINRPDVRIELYNAQGTLVASDTNSNADGRNAILTYTPQLDGKYVVKVIVDGASSQNSGVYTLSVTGADAILGSAPRVIRQSTADGQIVASPPSYLDLTFSEGLRLDTVQASDLVLDGGAVATSVQVIDGRTLRFFIDAQNVEVAYHYSLAAGVIQGLQGENNAAFTGSFVVDHGGPRVISQTPGQTTSAPFNQIDFAFSEAVSAASVTLADVTSFTGPGGTNLLGQITSVTVVGNVVSVRFNSQMTLGQYELVIGPNIVDIVGNAMDQNNNGIKGESADGYRAAVTVRSPDLTVTAVNTVSSSTFGQTLDVSWTVKNIGTDPAQQANWYDSVWLSHDNVLGGDDIRLTYVLANANPLEANGQYTRTAQVALPVRSDFATGNYYLIVRTDEFGYHSESSENNNTLASSVINLVRPDLDLQVRNLAVDQNTIQSGDTITIRWSDFNGGVGELNGAYYDRVYLRNTSTNEVLLDTTVYFSAAQIAAGQGQERSYSFKLPDGSRGAGNFDIQVTSDYNNNFYESNVAGTGESNNTTQLSVTSTLAPYPDLRVQNLSVDQNVIQSGDTITIRWNDFNGGLSMVNGAYFDRVYLRNTSTNEVLLDTTVYFNAAQVAVGQGQERSYSFKLPDGLRGTGTFDIQVTADYNNNVFESTIAGTGESNNTAQLGATSTLAPYPDLQIQNLAVDQNAIQSGDTITIRWNDFNSGLAMVNGAYYDRVYLRNTSTNEVLLDTTVYFSAAQVAAGQGQERSYSFKLPDGSRGVGALDIQVTGDYYNYVFESNVAGTAESNNAAQLSATSTLAPYPDLQSQNLAVDQITIQSGDTITIRWNDFNSGNKALNGAYYDRVYLRNTGTNEVLLDTTVYFNAAQVAAGQGQERSYSFKLPDGLRGAGTFDIQVTADYYNNVFESSVAGTAESNNTAQLSATSTLAPYPDLQIQNLAVDQNAIQSGDTITLRWNDFNSGNASVSGAFYDLVVIKNKTTGEELNKTTVYYDPTLSGNGAIGAGQSRARSFTFKLPDGIRGAGDIEISVAADKNSAGAGTIFEANQAGNAESNNASSTNIASQVKPYADLTVSSVTVPATASSGDDIDVIWQITNQGPVATSSSWIDRIILSQDGVVGNADDVVLGSVARNGALAAGTSYVATASVKIPTRIEGPYRIAVVTDVLNAVLEPDTRRQYARLDPDHD
ncbi:Ig-like domain-containing protein [Polaromonas sp. P2-4]|nr:Ig-like domain-containing protein [Polaromonas sp. P2-4]